MFREWEYINEGEDEEGWLSPWISSVMPHDLLIPDEDLQQFPPLVEARAEIVRLQQIIDSNG